MTTFRNFLVAGTALAVIGSGQALAQQPLKIQPASTEVPPKKPAVTLLDRIVISATMLSEAVIDALAPVSTVDDEQLSRTQASTVADIFRTTPGVAASMNGDDPATSINIRGLEQYGRVVVTLDGARQDYWRVGHGSGSFYVEPELLKEATVIRGPVSNAYGSGGIGGVVSFQTKDAGDFLNGDERWALSEKLGYESNGHELKLGAILQNYEDIVSGSSGSTSPTLSRYNAATTNHTYTAGYTYLPDDNPYVDLSVNFYHNRTRAEQTQIWPASQIGKFRYYDVATTGVNARNSSRFDAWGLKHTLTYGADYYYLNGDSKEAHFGSGTQRGYGGFLQWQGDYSDWLQVITAIRYDGYQLDGETKTKPVQEASLSGSRWSPRITVGVTPVEGLQLYGTYSEGYRAPGLQDVFRGGGAHGSPDAYTPNLLLQPETARSWEAGVNLKYDDVMVGGDTLRGKLNVFHTDVDDYIDVNLTAARMVTNIGAARLRGVEAEAIYDFGWGFVNGTAAVTDAKMMSGIYAGQTLNNTPLERFSMTFGVRALDDRLTMGVQYLSVGEITRTSRTNPTIPGIVSPGFNITNLFANYAVNDSLRLDAGIENLFNEAYTDPQSSWSTSAATKQGKGQTFKISLTGRIGG